MNSKPHQAARVTHLELGAAHTSPSATLRLLHDRPERCPGVNRERIARLGRDEPNKEERDIPLPWYTPIRRQVHLGNEVPPSIPLVRHEQLALVSLVVDCSARLFAIVDGPPTVPAEHDGAEAEAIRLHDAEKLLLGHELAAEDSVDVHSWTSASATYRLHSGHTSHFDLDIVLQELFELVQARRGIAGG